uniref:Toll-like receptor U n=1 Tax=Mytilus galloprovincialis TaxID=29158 RepID=M4VTK4_MYTGA|nr:toll-like receptor U precursor [Mytilus galloprovincialis]
MKETTYLFALSIIITVTCVEPAFSCTYRRNRKHQLVAHCENQGFKSVPRNLSRDIQELILSNNLINILKNNSFINYSNLEILSLSKNKISGIQEDAFAGLNSLKVLKVNDNLINITILPHDVFRHLIGLIVLDISRNKKQLNESSQFIYPDTTFSRLERLQNLSIDLFMFPVFGRGFIKLQNLNALNFDKCYLRNSSGFKLLNATFENFSSNLQQLYISGCRHFFQMEYGLLEHFPNLKVLDLSESYVHLYQALRILHPYQDKNMSVINFHHITDSSINGNDFPCAVVITVALMKYLRNICIEALDLSKTGIVDYHQNSLFSFKYPECFTTFIISANKLPATTADHYIEVITFAKNAKNMKVYDFSYLTSTADHPNLAYLNVYDPEAFYHFSKGTLKTEVHPQIQFFLPSSIEFLRFSYTLDLLHSASITCANTSLKYLDVSFTVYRKFPDLTNDCGKQLEYLDVSGIPVTEVTLPSVTLPKLYTLKMTNARIDQAVLKGKQWMELTAPEIRNVDISFNNLWSLDKSTFLGQPHIKHLNMSNNLFRTIPKFVTRLKKLESLDLSGNLITSIDSQLRLWMHEMTLSNRSLLLNFDNNAFICSCDTLDFLLWFAQTKVTFFNGDTYNCTIHDKQAVLREVIQNTKEYFSNCKSTIWLHVGIVLVASTFCILIPIIVIYNYRWMIILTIYRKVRRAVEKDLHENYMYDAYVSYEDRSVAWIKKFLLPKIEGEWGLKVCLHDRDILPGNLTADAKAESIQKSRHFVFIITEQFTEGKWGRFEIERAVYEKYTTNLRKIIVILQNIQVQDIPEEIVKISNDVCFIEMPLHENEIYDKRDSQSKWLKLKDLCYLN